MIITIPVHAITQNFSDAGHYVVYACEGGREAGAFILGAPFWVVESVLWRWPKALLVPRGGDHDVPRGVDLANDLAWCYENHSDDGAALDACIEEKKRLHGWPGDTGDVGGGLPYQINAEFTRPVIGVKDLRPCP